MHVAQEPKGVSENGAGPLRSQDEEGEPDLGIDGWTAQDRPIMPVIGSMSLLQKYTAALQLLQSAASEVGFLFCLDIFPACSTAQSSSMSVQQFIQLIARER